MARKAKKQKVVWKAVGKKAVRFIDGYWGIEDQCGSHAEAVASARRHNEEEEDGE